MPSECILMVLLKGKLLYQIMYWDSISKLVAPGGLVVSLTSPSVVFVFLGVCVVWLGKLLCYLNTTLQPTF
ncbi:hypothetical protein HanPSC8_Chr16g0719641 [Helianthus annuus]|nr:hypothetical protein HanPSC8_Chr16g0719641 [Helianthus annuus]